MQVVIEKLTTGARGMARWKDGRPAFASGVLPGETIEVDKAEECRGYVDIKSFSLVESSEKRITPSCPYAGICGGCDFDFVSAKDSAELKEEIVKDNLVRIAKLETLPEFLPPAFGPENGWRARARVHVDMKNRRVGFLPKRGKELVEVKNCPRLEKRLNDMLSDHDELIRASRTTLFQKGVNRKTGFIELSLFNGDDSVSLEEKECIRTIDGISYHVSGNVFFQSNPTVLPHLFEFVKDNVVGDSIMDLYSGVGTFSALFEGERRKVIAVERQKECLRLSSINAPSASSFTGDVALWGRNRKDRVDTVIVDPPRTGLDSGVPAMISSWRPERIIYVSCNSATLARDIPFFKEYKVEKAQVFDFYPGSSHEETVVLLTHKDSLKTLTIPL